MFDHCFGIPKVVVFAGHMIDRPERPSRRFPQALEKMVRRDIDPRLKRLDKVIGTRKSQKNQKRANQVVPNMLLLLDFLVGTTGFEPAAL